MHHLYEIPMKTTCDYLNDNLLPVAMTETVPFVFQFDLEFTPSHVYVVFFQSLTKIW
jgi:hypothetical protein